MPSALEIYREWENNPPASVVHVLVIFRGDGSDANVLTLTDKPYVDKGVDGTRYHHSRSAPIQCIVSDIKTRESMDSTVYDDLILANGEGLLDGVAAGEEIVGKPFVMYRGDQSWSILETDLPYRFEEIFVGQVENLEDPGGGGNITLRIIPKRYNLELTVANPDAPLMVGGARSVPMTLVDESTHKYRYNTTFPQSQVSSMLVVKDNGVVLTDPTDYSEVDESGVFKGLVQLVAAPSGKLTGNVRFGEQSNSDGPAALFVQFFINPEGQDLLLESSRTSPFNGDLKDIALADEIGKIYVRGQNVNPGYVYQRSYTTDIVDSTTDSKYIDLTTIFGGTSSDYRRIDVSRDGQYIFLLTTAGVLKRAEMSTPGDITTTMSSDQSLNLLAVKPSSVISHFRIIGDRLYYSTTTARIVSIDLPGDYDISGATLSTEVDFSGNAYGFRWYSALNFDIAIDKKSILILSDAWGASGRRRVLQIRLATADDLTSVYYDDRSLDIGFLNGYVAPAFTADKVCVRYFADDSKFFLSAYSVSPFDRHFTFSLVEGLLPRDIFSFKPKFSTSSAILFPSVYHDSSARAGDVLKEIISPVSDSFYINRFGKVCSVRIIPPEDASTAHFEITSAELLGDSKSWFRITGQQQKKKRVTLKYSPNFAVQSQAEIAGSVSDELRESYARQWYYLEEDVTGVPDFADSIVKEIYFFDRNISDDPQSDPPDYVMSVEKSLAEAVRTKFQITAKLGAIPHFSVFPVELGSFGNMNFTGSFVAADTMAQLHGREINWSQNNQTLEMFI